MQALKEIPYIATSDWSTHIIHFYSQFSTDWYYQFGKLCVILIDWYYQFCKICVILIDWYSQFGKICVILMDTC